MSSRIGLALAGGGPLGAIHEIGALVALEESIRGLDLNALDGYVGVSAGSFLAAGLANGMTARQLCSAFIDGDPRHPDHVPASMFTRPALGEMAGRLAALPALAGRATAQALRGRPWLSALEQLGRALPTGLFSHAPIEERLASLLSAPGRRDDFRALAAERGRPLYIVATDLDSGETLPFGAPGLDHVPISRAVAASAALPGLFPPVPVDGRWCVDGALKKTLHAGLLLEQGMDLLLCLNPLVPFDATHSRRHRVLGAGVPPIPRLVDGGLPLVLSQTFRSLIHSRLELGFKGYAVTHPQVDLLLLEPDPRDPTLFLANVFAYGQRRALAEHAYQATRAELRRRRSSLAPMLARHGLALADEALDDASSRLLRHGRSRHALPAARPVGTAGALGRSLSRLDEVLDDLERALPAR
jgi:NTE family protein